MTVAGRWQSGRLLEYIREKPHGRTSFRHLATELGAKGASREELERLLESLARSGELIEYKRGHYLAPAQSREYCAGRFQMHRDGYGFVIPDTRIEGLAGDVFVPPPATGQAMDGDRVVARIGRLGRDGRAEGEIVRIVKRAHPTVVGEFRYRDRGCVVVPHDDRVRVLIEIPAGMEIPKPSASADRIGVAAPQPATSEDLDGMLVNVELIEYPQEGRGAIGRVVEILGHPDDFGVDVEVIIRKHHLPHRFPAAVLAQAEGLACVIRAEEIAGRRDFRGMDIVTIDGETARDFDDAVWVDALPNGNFALHVHIADVSHYVQPGTPIDQEARLRGTSVYFPDRAVPMLPVELSTGLCSLNPHVDRLVLSVLLEIDRRGDIVAQEFARGVIRSVERMTYTDVHLLLEGDPGLRERYRNLVERFERMRELALVLNRRRVRRGSIDFDLPEPVIEFDEFGLMTGIARSPRNIAHRIIEEFMLAANEAVASHLAHLGVPSLYRVHERPDPERVMEFEELAARFGYSLGLAAMPMRRFHMLDRRSDGRKVSRDLLLPSESFEVSSRHYQKLIEKIAGKPEERILSYLMLRSLKQARYRAENLGHFALASPCYTHFTSPIRRYPDLIVHRILSAVLDGKLPVAQDAGDAGTMPVRGAKRARTRMAAATLAQMAPAPGPELEAIAEECSQTERRAADAERELVEWKKLKFMTDRLGDEFAALIISTGRYGFNVELEEYFIEGVVPIDALPGDHFDFQENLRVIVGRQSKRRFAIGDRLRVCLDRADGVERKLYFSPAELEPAPKRRSRRA